MKAISAIGLFYYYGINVEQDFVEAFKWFREAYLYDKAGFFYNQVNTAISGLLGHIIVCSLAYRSNYVELLPCLGFDRF